MYFLFFRARGERSPRARHCLLLLATMPLRHHCIIGQPLRSTADAHEGRLRSRRIALGRPLRWRGQRRGQVPHKTMALVFAGDVLRIVKCNSKRPLASDEHARRCSPVLATRFVLCEKRKTGKYVCYVRYVRRYVRRLSCCTLHTAPLCIFDFRYVLDIWQSRSAMTSLCTVCKSGVIFRYTHSDSPQISDIWGFWLWHIFSFKIMTIRDGLGIPSRGGWYQEKFSTGAEEVLFTSIDMMSASTSKKSCSACLLGEYERRGFILPHQYSLEGWNRSNFTIWRYETPDGSSLYHRLFTCPVSGVHYPCGRLDTKKARDVDDLFLYSKQTDNKWSLSMRSLCPTFFSFSPRPILLLTETARLALQAASAKALDYLNSKGDNVGYRKLCIDPPNMLPSGPVLPSMPYSVAKYLQKKRLDVIAQYNR